MKQKSKLVLLCLLSILVGIFINNKLQQLRKIKGAQTRMEVKQSDGSIYGIILPHHNFAREIIIDSYQQLSQEDFALIVLIGPNHFYPKFGKIISATTVSDAQNGLKTADWLINTMVENDLISLDQAMLDKEHSIITHLPYLNEFYPNIAILPLIMPVNPSPEKLNMIRELLVKLPMKTLVIASVDFSHNLSYLEALSNNKESLEAIQNFDYERISHFSDYHLDSPHSIILLLEIMEEKGARNFQVWHNTHSALVGNQINSLGTSYLIGVFKQ